MTAPDWKLRAFERSRGIRRTVPASHLRVQIMLLLRAGATVEGVATASSVSSYTVRQIYAGRRQRVRLATADRLLQLHVQDLFDADVLVPAVGTVRRFHALQAIGWTQAELARRTGVVINMIGRPGQPRVRASTARAVRRVYNELSMTPGPSPHARSHARRHGYAPPLAWDDDTIDDPNAQPALGQHVPRNSHEHSEHVAAEAAFLLSAGVPADEAAQRLGVTANYLTQKLPRRIAMRAAS